MHINMAAGEAQPDVIEDRFNEALDFIKYIFKVDRLYENRVKLIRAFCEGQNIFFNVPTGYGKSIVFQSLPWIYDMIHDL
jgi:superfamily II DNA helicase RecQ